MNRGNKLTVFKNFSIKKLLHNKKFAWTFAFVFAFLFWLIISINQNPEREQSFSNIPVNINTQGTVLGEMGIDVVDDSLSKTASVTVFGPNYVVSSLKAEDIKVSAVISDITSPGTYTVELVAARNSNKSDYSFVKVSPAVIKVKFDYIDTKEYTVVANADGASAVEGLVAESAIVNSAENSTVTVRGPRSDMQKIASVVAYAEVNKTLSITTSFDAEIKLYDENGKELDKSPFVISQDSVKISVPISKKKEIKVVPTFINVSSDKLTSTLKYTLSVSKATVIGPPDTVDTLDKIELTPIDITKLSPKDSIFTLSAVLPDGVRFLDNIEDITVTFDMSGYSEKTFNVTRFSVQNKPSDINEVNMPQMVKNIKICGPEKVIKNLSADSLVAYIDLTGKTAGEHTVSVMVRPEADTNVWQVGSFTVSVVLK